MKGFTGQSSCFAAIVITMAAWSAWAQNAPQRIAGTPRRGEAIIFSGTPVDSSSTNLSLNNPKAGIKSLEDEIKKPFDFFEGERGLAPIKPMPAVRQQQMIERTRRSQEFIRKEDAYFDVGDEDKTKADDPFSLDPEKRKLKSPLERYYERLEREQTGSTNQLRGRDVFGRKKNKEDAGDSISAYFQNGRMGDDIDLAARTGGRMSNGPASGGLFSVDPVKPRPAGDVFNRLDPEVAQQEKAREDRLDAFKKLIGVETYSTPKPVSSSFTPAPAPVAQPQPQSLPNYLYSTPSPPPPAASSWSGGSGSYGYANKSYSSWQNSQPGGYASSLTPTPAPYSPPKRLPPPTFSVPQRKF